MTDSTDWSAAADRALEEVKGMTEENAATHLDVSASTISRWQHLRDKGEEVPSPRGRPRQALQRFVAKSGNHKPPQAIAGGSSDSFLEVMMREARAAEKRAEAAASWARWLEKEADGWAAANGILRAEQDRRDTVAPLGPNPTPFPRKTDAKSAKKRKSGGSN